VDGCLAPDLTDADCDGIVDGCDGEIDTTDTDDDTVIDGCDNCPTESNSDQANGDGDATGDACDCDGDGSCTAITYCEAQLTPDVDCSLPLAHWAFDEGEGDIAYDSVGDHDGTLIGSPSWTTGQVGAALSFSESTGDHVAVANDGTFDDDVFTISAWLFPTATDTSSYIRRVGGWHVRTASNWDIVFESGGSGIVDSNHVMALDEWHHYVIVVDSSALIVEFYVDGVQVGSTQSISAAVDGALGDVYIGQFDSNYVWEGGIDDVKFYDIALDATEIDALYQAGLTP
jgi:hypothetical protein